MAKRFCHVLFRLCTLGNVNVRTKSKKKTDIAVPKEVFEAPEGTPFQSQANSKATMCISISELSSNATRTSTIADKDSTVATESSLSAASRPQDQQGTYHGQIGHISTNNRPESPLEVGLYRPSDPGVPSLTHPRSASRDNDRTQTELDVALENFNHHYDQFILNHNLHQLEIGEFRQAFNKAIVEPDITISSRIFEEGILNVIRFLKVKQQNPVTWTGAISKFITKLYPLARFSLRLTSAIAEVLQEDHDRTADFLKQLKRIEYQAARLAWNPNFDLMSPTTQRIMHDKSSALLTSIIIFFDSVLVSLNRLFKTICEGSAGRYENAKKYLEIAIQEYDQAVGDLTAIVLGELRFEQQSSRAQKADDEFIKWLSSSFWLVEAQLVAARGRRVKDTFQWLRNVPEFRNWSSTENGGQQMLWLKGPPGVGKSMMAAYFVDFMKCLHPEAIVTYFFCKACKTDLTSAADIVRTLAYQCIDDPLARSALEMLKRRGFQIDGKVGTTLLFEKLFKEPLRHTGKDVFIILDGLDEADRNTMDPIENKPQIDVLVECLSKLGFGRVMFLGRPPLDILEHAPSTVSKAITERDTANDIQKYVSWKIDSSPKLQRHFRRNRIEPVPLLVEKANGIFLWAVVGLQYLDKATSKTAFDRSLRNISATAGDMAGLYHDLLLQISQQDQRWLREILPWLVVGTQYLTLGELQAAVELSVDDEHDDFERFLDVQCGSLLRLVPDVHGNVRIQPIHETLPLFLSDSQSCPFDYFLDKEDMHAHIAAVCLDFLSVGKIDEENSFIEYASKLWVDHLSKAKRTGKYAWRLLTSISQLFASDGVENWIRHGLLKLPRLTTSSLRVSFEDRSLKTIIDWLTDFEDASPDVDVAISCKDSQTKSALQTALNWRNSIQNMPNTVGDLLGKAAGRIWLYEDLSTFDDVSAIFLLTLKHYWRQPSDSFSVLRTLSDLGAQGFRAMALWADEGKCRRPNGINIGVAYYTLRQWPQCINYFESCVAQADFPVWRYLSEAYKAAGDYDHAIQILESAKEKHVETSEPLRRLGETYEAKGDYLRARKLYEAGIAKFPSEPCLWRRLGETYRASGDCEGGLRAVKRAVEEYPLMSWPCGLLGELYHANGERDLAIKMFKAATRKLSCETNTWICLAEAFQARCLFEAAIETYSSAVKANPLDTWLWALVGDLYSTKGDIDSAIQKYEKAIHTNPTVSWIWIRLADIYKTKGDYAAVVGTFERAIHLNPHCSWPWSRLGEFYRGQENREGVTQLFKEAINLNSSESWPWFRYGEMCNLYGDVEGAIQTFKTGLQIDSLDLWALMGLGEAYKAKGELLNAAAIFQEAIREMPREYWLHKCLGDVYMAMHQYDYAVQEYDIAIQRAMAGPLISAYTATKRSGQYTQDYTMQIDEHLPESFLWNNYIQAQRKRGDSESVTRICESSIQEYESALKANENTLLWQFTGGASVFGEVDVFNLKQSLSKGVIWAMVGYLFRLQGDFQSSIAAFENVLRYEHGNQWVCNILTDLGCRC